MADRSEKASAPSGPGSRTAQLTGQDGKVVGTVLAVLLLLTVPTALYYYYSRTKITKVEVKGPPEAKEVEVDSLRYNVAPERPGATASAAPGAASTLTHPESLDGDQKRALEAVQAGDYEKAAGFFREALKEKPGSVDLKKALAASLARAAQAAASSGDYIKAKGLLTEAATLSEDTAYLKGLANIQISLDDLTGAAKTLSALSGDPKAKAALVKIYAELGNRSLNAGQREEAIKYYSSALALDPSDSSVSAALARLGKDSAFEGKMGRNDGAHFVIRFDGGENATAGYLIGILLEEAYAKVGSDLNFYPDGKVEALLYSRENFRDITRSPSWAGAIFDGRIKIPAGGVYEKTAELEKAVFHEYTHALVRKLSKGRAPTWLNEGLAQYEEGRDTDGYRDYLKNVASTGRLRLKYLEGSFMRLDSRSAALAYLISLSATRYMIREFGIFSVKRLLEKLGEGLTLDAAMRESVYMGYEDFEKSWVESLNG